MNKFYLPKIERMEINDYTLYNCPFIIDFTNKINIVFGTNGTGKSTLLMIILFSIIGPYRGTVKTKVRKDKRRDNRPIYDEDFFKDRMTSDENASVKVNFSINGDDYIVEHSLRDCKLLSVSVNDKTLTGKIVTYKTYESKFKEFNYETMNTDSDDGYLITNYHNSIRNSTKLPGGINTLISMLLDVMFFDESRSFTFWNSDLQETVIGKYIVDAQFYNAYCDKKLETKSLESKYKKRSETYNYMRKFFKEQQEKKENSDLKEVEIEQELNDLNKQLESLNIDLSKEQASYNKLDNSLMIISKEIEHIKEYNKILDEKWYKNLFPKPYFNYYNKFNNKMIEGNCPICGEKHDFNIKIDHCIFCNEKLQIEEDVDLLKLDLERKEQSIFLKKKNIEESKLKNELESCKNSTNNVKEKIQKLITRKNKLEINMNVKDEENNTFKALKIAKDDRNIALEEFNKAKRDEDKMRKTIEENLIDNFQNFANTFKRYSSSFFGSQYKINLTLPFSSNERLDDLMIKFVLNGKNRDESYMLSESQRIFTDLSFRFSILTNFHEQSFFMCETPDSTLDMFHEANAVNTFKEFVDRGNTLIITANARKSNLVSNLYNYYNKEDINVIDLTKISKLALSTFIDFKEYVEVD